MIVAIIQARTGSTRLPKKVLKKVCGKSLLEHLIERVKRVKHLDKIVVATTTKKEDEAIVKIAQKTKVEYFQGSNEDVLDRYYQAAKKFKADIVVRITGDCPLLDPEIVDTTINLFLKTKCDYVSNTHPPTFPDGMDVEVFSFRALERSWLEAKLISEREHVTLYVRNHPEIFRCGNVLHTKDISSLRLTVDEPSDFKLIKKIFQHLYPRKHFFGFKDILKYLESFPRLLLVNKTISRNEGLVKSLRAESLKKY
ncbi:MAG: glycosyltransferase family protein [Patescibacteria group bacterium]